MTFHGMEPWGFETENRRFGMLAAVVANFAGKTSRKAFQPADFMPRKPETPMTLAQRIRKAFGVPENHGKAS